MQKIQLVFFYSLCLIPALIFGQPEICGDNIDNDGDGRVDEVCQPFACDGSLYQSAEENGDFILYRVDVNPIQFLRITDLTQNGVTGNFNSLAYNPLDNYMYGMGTNDAKLYRIDATGAVEFLGNVAGMNGVFKNAGTFDNQGNYYVYGDNQLRRININTLTFTNIGGQNTYGSADIVFSPVDNQIYGWSGNPKLLFKMDPNTGAQTKIPGNAPLVINGSWGWIGAMYFNAQGDILAYQGTRMAKIDPTTGIATPVGTGSSKRSNDGCSCSFGVEMTKAANATTYQSGDTIEYLFNFFNQSFVAINNSLVFEDILTGGFVWASEPYDLTNIQFVNPSAVLGKDTARFTINSLPKGNASFKMKVVVPCGYSQSNYTNQATLSNLPPPLKSQIESDNPLTATIGDPTTVSLTTNPIQLNSIIENIICEQAEGSIDVLATGGTVPFTYQWSDGQTDSKAIDLAAGTYGVTVTSSNGCEDSLKVTVVTENINLNTTFEVEDAACVGDENGAVQIDATTGGYAPYFYSLDNSTFESNTTFDDLSIGSYVLYTKDSYGCRGQVPFRINQPTFVLDIEAPTDARLLIGEQIRVDMQQNTLTPVKYEWTPSTGLSCANCKTPVIQLSETTTYTIKGTDILGCTDSTTFTVQVDEDNRFYIPNAFSPNAYGENELFMIYSPGDVVRVKSMQVYDRWGELVFHQNDFLPNLTAHSWDGTFNGQALNAGVYIYKFELELLGGTTKVVMGDVTLIK
jgi:gliding motility-associated-like protein/uncharacterized repeat protein (TIGR01451 family)